MLYASCLSLGESGGEAGGSSSVGRQRQWWQLVWPIHHGTQDHVDPGSPPPRLSGMPLMQIYALEVCFPLEMLLICTIFSCTVCV